MKSIESTLERQKVVDPKLRDRDVWGLFREGNRGALAIVPVRGGMMLEPRTVLLSSLAGEDEEVLSSLVNDAYERGGDVPPEILVPFLPAVTLQSSVELRLLNVGSVTSIDRW